MYIFVNRKLPTFCSKFFSFQTSNKDKKKIVIYYLYFRISRIEEEHNRILNQPEVMKRMKSYKNLTKELTHLSGINITTSRDIFTLYCDLICLKHMEFDLPSWVDEYLQNKQFLEAGLARLEFVNYNKIIQRLNAGNISDSISS